MARFTAIPNIPQAGLTDWQFNAMSAMKENIELLTGARNEVDGASRALTKSSITIISAPTQSMQRVTAEGVGFTISGVNVVALSDYEKLVVNVQQLANDVAALRNTLNSLITQLKQ